MEARGYQKTCVQATTEALASHQGVLNILPTGTGKTVVIGMLARSWPGQILVIADRREIVSQNAEVIREWSDKNVGVEMAESRCTMFEDVIVGSIQTLIAADRMKAFDREAISLVVIDEAHHAAAESYAKLFNYFGSSFRVGFTATPDRADGVSIMGSVFEDVAYQMTILDAIRQGWLTPLVSRDVSVDSVDFSHIEVDGLDFTDEQLAEVLATEEACHGIVDPFMEHSGDRQGIIFWPSVESARKGCEIINRHEPDSAVWISGAQNPGERKVAIDRYRSSDARILNNVSVCCEGFDAPCECVAIARPTRSRSRYVQMVGRGLRPLPGTVDGPETPEARREAIANSAKPDCLVLDYAGNRHDLVNCGDIFAEGKDRATVEYIKRKARYEDLPNWEELVSKLDVERDEILKLRIELDQEQLKEIKGKAKFTISDPFTLLGYKPKIENWQKKKAPTDFQKNTLLHHGLEYSQIPGSYAECGELLKALRIRNEQGLVGYKEAVRLAEQGVDPRMVSEQTAGMH